MILSLQTIHDKNITIKNSQDLYMIYLLASTLFMFQKYDLVLTFQSQIEYSFDRLS
jgi:hypothetical protein